MNIIVKSVTKNYNNLYLYYIRYKIFKINKVDDIVKIFRLIDYYQGYKSSTDSILNFLIQSFTIYELTDIEMQKISLYQQFYSNKGDIYEYVTLTLWLAVVESFSIIQ